MSSYAFRPYEITELKYKNYDGVFNRGINMYPRPRSGHRIVCHESDVFCFGGFNPAIQRNGQTTLFRELWRFNTITKKWTLLIGLSSKLFMPKELASHAMCMYGNLILVFGGTAYPFGVQRSNRLVVLAPYTLPDIKSMAMMDFTGTPPDEMYGQATLVHEHCLYVVGGTTGHDFTCDIHQLDLQTLHWTCVSKEIPCEAVEYPVGRYRHEIACDDEYIYVIGGGIANDSHPLHVVPAFQFKTSKWEYLQTIADPNAPEPGIPESRKCHTCVQHTNDAGQVEVVITGGNNSQGDSLNDIWYLNLSTKRWRLMNSSQLPYPVHFHDAALCDSGLMYVFGGIENRNNSLERSNKMYKMWIRIPKLSEICFEAMLEMQPKLPLFDEMELRRFGLPERFVNRLRIPSVLRDEL